MAEEKIIELREQDMIDIIWGATLMGAGGGGSISSGIKLMESYKERHPGEELLVKMIDASDMKVGEYASATAGMGAPAAIVGVDFSEYAANAANLLKEIAERDGKNLKYNFPVELGGFSIFFPLLLSLNTGAYTIDADGAGRAVPALETLLLNVNGCPTSPLGLANGNNDRISVELADPYNAPLAEKIGRDICGEFGNMVGISGWLVNKDDIMNKICTGTITLCRQIGEVLRTSPDADTDMFEALKKKGLINAKVICKGTVDDIKTDTHGGFDYGTLTVTDDVSRTQYYIQFQNENLLLQRREKGSDVITNLMTVPDMTCVYCIDPAGAEGVAPRMPLSNADVKKGMKIAVAAVKVSEKWFQSPNWWDVWAECMKNIGYEGENLPYENVPVLE